MRMTGDNGLTDAARAVRDIATRHDLEDSFPPAVQREVEAIAATPGIDDDSLDDLRDVAFVTIDEATSRDLDQALHVTDEGEHGFRLRYAIADAAWFVRRGSALFDEALRRGASFYLPGHVFPMLPRALSEGLVSLNPNVDRRAMVFDLRLDATGALIETRIRRARVRSRAKLAFDDVQRFLDGEAAGPASDDPQIASSLLALRTLGERLIALSHERSVVRYRRNELDIRVGDEPARFVAVRDLRNDVERYNEQVSVLYNVEGARLLGSDEGEAQPIFRVHPPPEPGRIADLERTIDAIVRAHGLEDAWRWRRSEGVDLARYLESLPERGARGRVAAAIHRQALVTNGRSSYRAEAGAHFGVGAPFYARFTAPMREVVGIFVHGEAWQRLGVDPPGDRATDEALRERVIESANRARELQKRLDDEANRVVLDALFARDLAEGRPPRSATLMGLTSTKVHLTLDDPPIDVKLYASHLPGDLALAPDRAAILRADGAPAARIGDRVLVQVVRRDPTRDRWELSLA